MKRVIRIEGEIVLEGPHLDRAAYPLVSELLRDIADQNDRSRGARRSGGSISQPGMTGTASITFSAGKQD